MFKIEKKIPITRTVTPGAPAKYPWRVMQVGDSFFVPNIKSPTLAGSSNAAAKRLNMKFTVRAVEGGVRVWRVK
jgi:hypothetical protein